MKTWQRKMKNSWLGRWESNFSLQNVIMQKLVYPLLATTFTPKQCKAIMSPILAQGLPSAGYICTFPHGSSTQSKKILWCQHSKSVYRTNTHTHPHTSQVLKPTTWLNWLPTMSHRRKYAPRNWSHWATVWSPANITGSNYRHMDATDLDSNTWRQHSPNDWHPRFPTHMTRWHRINSNFPPTRTLTTTTGSSP